MKMRRSFVLAIILFSAFSLMAIEINSTGPNSDPAYVQLRHVRTSGEAYSVQNLKIVRDAGTFELRSGTLCLLAPVQGMITGAVFHGIGSFHLQSNDPREQNQMKTLTGAPGIDDEFEKLVMRFADGTPEELKKVLTTKPSEGCPGELLEDNQKFLRTELKANLSARLLQPVLAGKPDGSFFAFFQGKKYGKLGFLIDPHGLYNMRPEEVGLFAYSDFKHGSWYSGHLLSEPHDDWHVKQTNHDSGPGKAVNHKIDATIEKNGTLSATTTETFTALVDDLRVMPFQLFHKLRVSKVTDGDGNPLGWIQEDKDLDGGYFVLLAKPAKKGEQVVVTSTYSGKDAVLHEGDGNYYPTVRENWYPNTHFEDYAMYQMTFRIPKNLMMAATGTLVSQHVEGNQNVTEWKSDVPLSVAGFNFGDFKSETVKLDRESVQVTAYANKEIPDSFKRILNGVNTPFPQKNEDTLRGDHVAALGSMNTTPMLKKSLVEASLAVELYTNYFGPMSYKSLEVTQQTAGNYGQAWPGLVFLPIYYFLDTTQRHQLHLDNLKSQYWKVVEPHEVAHEWWGHAVGFAGYRDQWMSEGFADFSASLFIQYIRKDRKEYLQYWKDLHDQLLEKDSYGQRPIDVGSVTMGYRVSTSKVGGWTGQHVLYPKGAYILHMLRQMMYTAKTGDADFKAMMHDLVNTYRNQPITTEDFKAMVEKHMTPAMNAAGDHKMDWFFDEWVYGTEIPSYSFDSTPEPASDGTVTFTMKLTQSGVSPSFRMVVPVYFEMADGKVGKAGQVMLVGNQTITQKVPMGNTPPVRMMINYNYDVLAN
jgi:hypothetical protein